MFTIDLLKGQGIPIKRKPWGAAIAALAFTVPILAAMAMVGLYFSNRIVINVVNQEIANYEKNIKALSDAVELQKKLETEKNDANSCLSEALSAISKHTQWSPVLITVVENMPDSMVLTRLEVKQGTINKKVPKKDNPQKTIDISIPVNTLNMSVSGGMQADSDKSVKDFKDRLRFSPLLSKKLEDIVISQKTDTVEGKDVVSYDIDCVFKSEM
jgi:Tfp pilus assembly protein PilN